MKLTHQLELTLLAAACFQLGGCSEERETIETAVLYVAAGTQQTTALAGFYGEVFGLNRCEREVFGSCEVATCLDGGSVRDYVDGGIVDVTGDELDASLDTGKVVDDDGNEGPGFASIPELPALANNEEISFKVRGKGTVSTAEGSIVMPPRLELVEPALEDPSCQTVAPEDLTPIAATRGSELSVRFVSEQFDDVDLLFFFDEIADYTGDEDRERFTSIRCLHTADEEDVMVPEEVTERMPNGVRGSFSIRQIVRNARLVGNWSITFGGYWELCSPILVD
jgi:hypothetical protein